MGCHVKTIFYMDGVQLICCFVVNRLAGRWFKSKNILGISHLLCFFWSLACGWWVVIKCRSPPREPSNIERSGGSAVGNLVVQSEDEEELAGGRSCSQ